MIAQLTYNPDNVIVQEPGKIIVNLDYEENFAPACQIVTADALSQEEFENNVKRNRTIYIGVRGGIGSKAPDDKPYRCPFTLDIFELEQAA